MAQLHFDAYHAPGQTQQGTVEPLRVGLMVNVVGAVLSVALLAGVGVWSYRLMVRDVSGVPVIRALEGPMRVSPEDPGGRQAAYQGLAVNAIAAEGSAGAAADEIVLAPGPVELASGDRPVAALPTPAPSQPAQNMQPAVAVYNAVAEASFPVQATPASLTLESLEPLDLVPSSTPGIARSPVPPRRPTSSAAAVQMASVQTTNTPSMSDAGASSGRDAQAEAVLVELATRLAPARHVDVDPSSLTPGTRLVQLGAYDDEPAAREAWEALAGRFSAHLDGPGRIIEPATSGGRTFYRLRAHGFDDEPEARRFCAVLLAENADCIPVLIR
ncbi:SPOR domain-containing protein [Pararhodobacter sp.]|uniref:SPOR domain-containing protein n=1 Tax=Pararhodobacter sp. TaxID=2127056 RepID=UPI002FDE50F7